MQSDLFRAVPAPSAGVPGLRLIPGFVAEAETGRIAAVNEYLPGQGIAQHVDCVPCFGGTVASLSLLSPCTMRLEPAGGGGGRSRSAFPLAACSSSRAKRAYPGRTG